MARAPASRTILFVLLTCSGLAADLITKRLVFQRLGVPGGRTDWLIDGWLKFRLYTTFNHGALWGVGQGMTWLFAALSVAAVAGVLYWLFWSGGARSWWLTIALALVTAGTLGNLWDRAGMHGVMDADGHPIFAVRDFLHFRFGTFDWAVFNVADMLLVTGAVMLGLQSLRPEPNKIEDQRPQPAGTVAGSPT
jgi:signal peptidase II